MTLPLPWRMPLLMWGVMLAVLLVTQWDAASGMALLWWRSDTFAHAMLVPPISLWLVWRQRRELAGMVPQPCWAGLILLLAALVVGHAGWLTEVNVLQHFGVVLTLQAMTLVLFGWTVTRAMAFPLLFLLFAPPFGEFMTEPMMAWTADFVVKALQVTGIPVYREGQHFVIPSGNWSVVEACSGVRYLMASFMVGTLFAYISYERWPKRLAFMAFSIAVPIVANWLRGYLIVMIGHLSNNQLATGADHLVYGWVFFGLIMMLMFWAGGRWADSDLSTGPNTLALEPGERGVPMASWSQWGVLGALLLGVQGGLSMWVSALRPEVRPPTDRAALQALALPDAWQPAPREGRWNPVFLGASAELRTAWARRGEPAVHVDVAYYPVQRADAKAVNSMNLLIDTQDTTWSTRGSSVVEVESVSVRDWHFHRAAIPGSEAKLYRARRLYWIDGRYVGLDRQAKLQSLRQLVAGRGEAAAVVVLLSEDDEGAAERLAAVQSALFGPLTLQLERVQGGPGKHN